MSIEDDICTLQKIGGTTFVISSSIKFLFLNNEAYIAKKLEISDFNIWYEVYSFILLPKDLFMKNGQQTTKVIFKVK